MNVFKFTEEEMEQIIKDNPKYRYTSNLVKSVIESQNTRIADKLKGELDSQDLDSNPTLLGGIGGVPEIELKQTYEPIRPKLGTKHDNGKIDLSILSRASLEAEASVMMFGEKKYGRDNYRQGFENIRLIAAALRHITAYNDGEDNDSESGLSHLNHAKACLGMLITNIHDGKSIDKRYKENK